MSNSTDQRTRLRTTIIESLRVQRSSASTIDYIDPLNSLPDVMTKQNHVLFGRRGCGKSLLLHHSTQQLPPTTKVVYLNCEDFKNHSFPNVLLEILDAVFDELETHVSSWFGRKKRCKEAIQQLRVELKEIKSKPDESTANVKESSSNENSNNLKTNLRAKDPSGFMGIGISAYDTQRARKAVEREYQENDSKIQGLSLRIPQFKKFIREVFDLSSRSDAVFVQLDDFYHLPRTVQPHVMDYIHRVCKDVPLYFKVATLRHSSSLFVDRNGQPTGAQERHDYQSIDLDYSLQNAIATERQLWRIFEAYGEKAGMSSDELRSLFKGEGFRRVLLAGGGVPRDCLSLFLEALDNAASGDGRVGKDDVRLLSLSNLERRIQELKADCQQGEQNAFLKGIYVLRMFCIERETNVFLVLEKFLQSSDSARQLVNRLLDYRIIHLVGTAYTHKHKPGTYRAYMIDIGAYAYMRKLRNKLREIDVFASTAKDSIRAAPVVDESKLEELWRRAPEDSEKSLLGEPPEDVELADAGQENV